MNNGITEECISLLVKISHIGGMIESRHVHSLHRRKGKFMTISPSIPDDFDAIHKLSNSFVKIQGKLIQLQEDYAGHELVDSVSGQLAATTVIIRTLEILLKQYSEDSNAVFQILCDFIKNEIHIREKIVPENEFGYEEGYLKGLRISLEKAHLEYQDI